MAINTSRAWLLSCVSLYITFQCVLCLSRSKRFQREDKFRCTLHLLDWCAELDVEQESSYSSFTYNRHEIFCNYDEYGTVCVKDEVPWFYCTDDHRLIYDGRFINEYSWVDSEICHAKDVLSYISFDEDQFKKDMEFDPGFYDMEEDMEEEMEDFKSEMEDKDWEIDFFDFWK